MKRVVLDTNIYISAIHFPGSPTREILEKADAGFFRLVISKPIITEIRSVLRIKFDYDLNKLELYENLLLAISELVEPKEKITRIKDDPDDNRILECAVEGKADCIVSGDRHLLEVGSYKGVKIVSSREVLEEYLS